MKVEIEKGDDNISIKLLSENREDKLFLKQLKDLNLASKLQFDELYFDFIGDSSKIKANKLDINFHIYTRS